MWLLLNEDASWNKQSVIGRLFSADSRPADNRPKHYRCTSSLISLYISALIVIGRQKVDPGCRARRLLLRTLSDVIWINCGKWHSVKQKPTVGCTLWFLLLVISILGNTVACTSIHWDMKQVIGCSFLLRVTAHGAKRILAIVILSRFRRMIEYSGVPCEQISCRWVRRFASNEGIKEGYSPKQSLFYHY